MGLRVISDSISVVSFPIFFIIITDRAEIEFQAKPGPGQARLCDGSGGEKAAISELSFYYDVIMKGRSS
jgi:hypothetical protein